MSDRSVPNLKPIQQSRHSPMNSPGLGREAPEVSIIFAVLFRRFAESKTKVLYHPDWQAARIMGKRSKVI